MDITRLLSGVFLDFERVDLIARPVCGSSGTETIYPIVTMKSYIKTIVDKLGYQIRRRPNVPLDNNIPNPRLSVFQAIALDYLRELERVSFVQVGANDGVTQDPIHKLVTQYCWQGLLIEPDPEAFSKLCENYQDYRYQLKFENVAIAGHVGFVDLYLVGGGFANSINKRHSKRFGCSSKKVRIPCLPLRDVLSKHSINAVDCLQVDAEGFDDEVIYSFPLSKMKPGLIQFEHCHLHKTKLNGICSFLHEQGYDLYKVNDWDMLAYMPQ